MYNEQQKNNSEIKKYLSDLGFILCKEKNIWIEKEKNINNNNSYEKLINIIKSTK